MGDETTTQKTELPEMTPEEQALQAMALAMIPEQISQAGYDLIPRQEYKNPAKVAEYESKIANIQTRLEQINATPAGRRGSPLLNEASMLQNQLNDLNSKLATEKADVKTTYDVQMNERGRKLQEEADKSVDRQAALNQMSYDNIVSFFNGELSVSPSQQQYIKDNLAAIREPVFKLLDTAAREYETTGKSINDAITEVQNVARETGVSFTTALNAVSERIDDTNAGVLASLSGEEDAIRKTGDSVAAALQGVRDEINTGGDKVREDMERLFTIKKTLAAQEKLDLYNDMRMKTANQAKALGRSQFDPQFQAQLQDELFKSIDVTNLKLAEQEAMIKLGIAQDISGKLEQLAYNEAQQIKETGLSYEEAQAKRTQLAAETGSKKEAVAAAAADFAKEQGKTMEQLAAERVGVAERTGAGREAIALSKADTEKGIQSYASGLRDELAINTPLKLIGVGADLGGYQSALRQQELANTAAAASAGTQQQEMSLRERMAQPTITQTTSGSPLGGVLGTIGALSGAAGGVMTGAGALVNASGTMSNVGAKPNPAGWVGISRS